MKRKLNIAVRELVEFVCRSGDLTVSFSGARRSVEAIRAQNTRHAGLTQADIDGMDQTWRTEVGAPGSALITGAVVAVIIRGVVERPDIAKMSAMMK